VVQYIRVPVGTDSKALVKKYINEPDRVKGVLNHVAMNTRDANIFLLQDVVPNEGQAPSNIACDSSTQTPRVLAAENTPVISSTSTPPLPNMSTMKMRDEETDKKRKSEYQSLCHVTIKKTTNTNLQSDVTYIDLIGGSSSKQKNEGCCS